MTKLDLFGIKLIFPVRKDFAWTSTSKLERFGKDFVFVLFLNRVQQQINKVNKNRKPS